MSNPQPPDGPPEQEPSAPVADSSSPPPPGPGEPTSPPPGSPGAPSPGSGEQLPPPGAPPPPPGSFGQEPPPPPGGQGFGPPEGPPGGSKLPLILGIVVAVVVPAAAVWFLVVDGDDDDAMVSSSGTTTTTIDEGTTTTVDEGPTTTTGGPTTTGQTGGGQVLRDESDVPLDDLYEILATTDDLTDGYVETYRGERYDRRSDDVDGLPPECEAAFDEMDPNAGQDRYGVRAEFEHPGDATVEHTLSLVQETDPSLGEIVQALQEHCAGSFTISDDGFDFQMQIDAEWVDGLGDEAVVMTMTLDHSQFVGSMEIYALGWVRDGVLSGLTVSSGYDEAASTPNQVVVLPADTGLAHRVADVVDARIREVLD